MTPPLVLVAHGSRDPRSARTVRRTLRVLRRLAPDLPAEVAFLDLSTPSVPDALDGLHRRGHREAVVVPLLLGSAYHARVDLPGLIAEQRTRTPGLTVTVADVLGADPMLESVARQRLSEAGADLADPGLGVVLAAVGSSDARANAVVGALAGRWHARHAARVGPAYATAAAPDVPAALTRLRAKGATRFAVAPWFLAPGLLLDRVITQARAVDPSVRVAEPLGAHEDVARLVLRRYRQSVQFGQPLPGTFHRAAG